MSGHDRNQGRPLPGALFSQIAFAALASQAMLLCSGLWKTYALPFLLKGIRARVVGWSEVPAFASQIGVQRFRADGADGDWFAEVSIFFSTVSAVSGGQFAFEFTATRHG